MGSDKKSEKRKRDSSPSSFQDEGKTKSFKTAEGSKEKRKSSSKNKESSSLKSHKHPSDKEKKSGDKHKDKHRKKDQHQKSEIQELTEEDYFSKNKEFATWLKEERKIYFSDLSSDSARELFSGFVKKWNKRKLKPQYYEGISTAPRSGHNWKIK